MSITTQLDDGDRPCEVALLFPPLVKTSFGTYFPSTAVLAGHLTANGIRSVQADLNEEFALYLLDDDILGAMAGGRVAGSDIPIDAMPAVAARLLRRNRHLLFDDRGRHNFRDETEGVAQLLHPLARPYLIDLPLPFLLAAGPGELPLIDVYDDFYAWSGIAETLDAAIHTVGISVPMGPQLAPSIFLARHLKRHRPDLKVIFGGPTLSLMDPADLARLLLGCREIDAVVRFDGERPLLALAKRFAAGEGRCDDIPGVSSVVDGRVVHVPPQEGHRLDDLAFAEFDPSILGRLAEPELGIVQARGCYWGECSYCDFVELYDGSPSYRTRTPKSFVDEMEYQIARHGVRRFGVITEAIPPAFSRRISEEIVARGLDLRWNSFAMVERRFTPELFELMVKGGCEYLVVGIETMNDRVLRLVRKAATEEDNTRFLVNARNAGIGIHINLIPDLPTTTYAEAIRALEIFRELRGSFNSASVFPFEATRSSAIGRAPGTFGLQVVQIEGVSGQAQNVVNHLEVIDPAMTPAEREEVIGLYHAFAAEINGVAVAGKFDPAPDAPHQRFRLAWEHLDLVGGGEQMQCYHMATRQLFFMPAGWFPLLRMVNETGAFERGEFLRRFDPPEVGEMLFDQMMEHRMLVVDDSPAPSPARSPAHPAGARTAGGVG